MSSEPKLSYVSSQLRVKLEIDRKMAINEEKPPEDLFERAENKMYSLLKTQTIKDYVLYQDHLAEVWERLRSDDVAFPYDKVIDITIAQGFPDMSAVQLASPTPKEEDLVISFRVNKNQAKTWRIDWIEQHVNREIQRMFPNRKVNLSALLVMWLSARRGIKVEGQTLPLIDRNEIPEIHSEKRPFAVVGSKARKEVSIVFNDFSQALAEKNKKEIFEVGQKMANEYFGNIHCQAKFYASYYEKKIDELESTPAGLGIGMPVSVLVAVGLPMQKKMMDEYPGKGLLKVLISDDKMLATIGEWDVSLYENKDVSLDLTWLEKELTRMEIAPEAYEGTIDGLTKEIDKKTDLSGLIIAEGKMSTVASEPFLHPIFLDIQREAREAADSSEGGLRTLKQGNFVSKGDQVAEVQYAVEGAIGYTVHGETLPEAQNPVFTVKMGDHIEEKETGKYYALADGIPTVEENSVSLSVAMHHEGDVNLRSGDIVFDGPLTIEGSIDNGATVECTQDLEITGMIRGGFVRCGGNLKVVGGIVTGEQGRVSAEGDISADFIENSNVSCKGGLIVKKVVLNSNVFVGKGIQILDKGKGILAGGQISCWEDVWTWDLGFKDGAPTVLSVGADSRNEMSKSIREKRVEYLTETQTKDRGSLREITRKKASQLTDRHKEMKVELQERVGRLSRILEKAEAHLVNAKAAIKHNGDAKVYVENIASPNLSMTIGGKTVGVPSEVAGIVISGKKKNGSFIQALTDEDTKKSS